ncbi:hypothetical protein HOG48_03745 [Candidatus Peregrinibacteria bacterium]|jgi:competence protein ComGC|nr:hypothetical protein [Candidatus Peregrinibacteria bacterium]
MRNIHQNKNAFTLLELLIVTIVIIIILGAGVPTLFRAAEIFSFKKDTATVKIFFDEVRSAALNNKSLPEAASFGVDTNYDGIPTDPSQPGDTVPFHYVLDLAYSAADEEMTLRLYAAFSEDHTYGGYSGNDILIKEKTISGDYNWEFVGTSDGEELDAENSSDIYSFEFQPPFGDLQILDSSDAENYYDNLTFTLNSPELMRAYSVYVIRNTGVVMYSEETAAEMMENASGDLF